MQLHHALSLVALAFVGPLVAQPTLTFDNNGPVPVGAPFAVSSYSSTTPSTFYSSGSTGADQIYGFWMIPETGNHDQFFVDPSVTPTAASFPTATVFSTNGGQDTMCYKVDAAGIELVGVRTATEGIAPYTDGAIELVYPCTFGTTWNDAFSASLIISSIPVTRAGTVTGIADGYGTIQLPGTELNDVLRVKVRKVQIDQTPLGVLYRSYESYYFFQEDIHFPVMKTSQDTLIISNGAPSVTWSADWLYGNDVGIQDMRADDVVFTPYPNPTNGQLDLRTEGEALRSVEVLNATGQVLISKSYRNAGTIAAGPLDLSALASGVYNVRITQADGRRGTSRVVVQ